MICFRGSFAIMSELKRWNKFFLTVTVERWFFKFFFLYSCGCAKLNTELTQLNSPLSPQLLSHFVPRARLKQFYAENLYGLHVCLASGIFNNHKSVSVCYEPIITHCGALWAVFLVHLFVNYYMHILVKMWNTVDTRFSFRILLSIHFLFIDCFLCLARLCQF